MFIQFWLCLVKYSIFFTCSGHWKSFKWNNPWRQKSLPWCYNLCWGAKSRQYFILRGHKPKTTGDMDWPCLLSWARSRIWGLGWPLHSDRWRWRTGTAPLGRPVAPAPPWNGFSGNTGDGKRRETHGRMSVQTCVMSPKSHVRFQIWLCWTKPNLILTLVTLLLIQIFSFSQSACMTLNFLL